MLTFKRCFIASVLIVASAEALPGTIYVTGRDCTAEDGSRVPCDYWQPMTDADIFDRQSQPGSFAYDWINYCTLNSVCSDLAEFIEYNIGHAHK